MSPQAVKKKRGVKIIMLRIRLIPNKDYAVNQRV